MEEEEQFARGVRSRRNVVERTKQRLDFGSMYGNMDGRRRLSMEEKMVQDIINLFDDE